MVAISLERVVRGRADECCEYCRLPEAGQMARFHIEHVIAIQHGGLSVADNLALACPRCNRHKGPNLSGIDRSTGLICRLYKPRNEPWRDHLSVSDGVISGLTDIGRTTIFTLNMNDRRDVRLRAALRLR